MLLALQRGFTYDIPFDSYKNIKKHISLFPYGNAEANSQNLEVFMKIVKKFVKIVKS